MTEFIESVRALALAYLFERARNERSIVTSVEKAKALIAAIEAELARGTRHLNKAGRELKSVREVLEALRSDGEVVLETQGGGDGGRVD